MIEINLVPDVKQELIKAQRVRASVISMAILVGIAAVGIVVVLAIWVFAIQTARGVLSDNTIKSESQKLSSVQDVSNTLTIQNQLSKLPDMHNDKSIDSRIFDILTTINPPDPNNVAITNLSLDSTTTTIKIEAQAVNGYPALDVFKKTINATALQFTQDGEKQSVPLATGISDSDRSYGEDATGAKVLRFTLTFTYPGQLFAKTAQNATIVAPNRTNATDSFQGVPQSLFTQKATDTEEAN
jgi:Tfp pilus assembly protein PilN